MKPALPPAPQGNPGAPPNGLRKPWKHLRAALRLLHGIWHLGVGLWTIQLHFPRLPPSHQSARVQAWAQRLLVILGVELVVQGTPAPQGPMLLVANHISWLDILVMHAARHCLFVSKADIARWPLIGTLATGAGTLYIERSSRRDALRVVQHMTQALTEGEVVAVFPEGTTNENEALLPFHGNLIQAAISAQAPVQPVALRFLDRASGAPSPAPRYGDHDSLLSSVWRTLCSEGIQAVVHFGQPQTSNGRNRRQWAGDLQTEVAQLRDGTTAHD